jgi:hypothetical protein
MAFRTLLGLVAVVPTVAGLETPEQGVEADREPTIRKASPSK